MLNPVRLSTNPSVPRIQPRRPAHSPSGTVTVTDILAPPGSRSPKVCVPGSSPPVSDRSLTGVESLLALVAVGVGGSVGDGAAIAAQREARPQGRRRWQT